MPPWHEVQSREAYCRKIIEAAWSFAGRDAQDRYRAHARRCQTRLSWEYMYNWCVQDEEWLECIMLSRLS